jgi:CHRD domain-containing protein
MHRPMAVGAVVLAAAAAVAVPTMANASSGFAKIGIVRLSAAQEVPGPGDAAGSAIFIFTAGPQRLCYALITRNLSTAPVASHIHVASAGVAGPITVALGTPAAANSAEAACIDVVPDDQQTPANQTMVLTRTEEGQIINATNGFYVNVHTQAAPAGAIRAQLR